VRRILLRLAGAQIFSAFIDDGAVPVGLTYHLFTERKEHRIQQMQQRLIAGVAWDDGGFPNLVFTNDTGGHLTQSGVWKLMQKALRDSGIENLRFHDLRHTYAVNSLRSGDDVKTVQENLGHHTAAFTLDQYGHVTDTMKRASADRMQAFIKAIPNA